MSNTQPTAFQLHSTHALLRLTPAGSKLQRTSSRSVVTSPGLVSVRSRVARRSRCVCNLGSCIPCVPC